MDNATLITAEKIETAYKALLLSRQELSNEFLYKELEELFRSQYFLMALGRMLRDPTLTRMGASFQEMLIIGYEIGRQDSLREMLKGETNAAV